MMGNKVRTTLTIDKDVLQTAMKMGLNVSQYCENCLREAIQKLKSPPAATNGKTRLLGEASFSKEGSIGGPDRTRTGDLLHVKQMSYRARLPAHRHRLLSFPIYSYFVFPHNNIPIENPSRLRPYPS